MTPIAGFHEEWFGDASQDTLGDLVRSVSHVAGDVVEVGSWEGRSTCALARACHPRIVHAVDTWQGSTGEISFQLAQRRDVFAQWSTNVEMFTQGNVVAHRMGWRDYFGAVTAPVAFCFIDAEHSYVEVRDNIAAVLPLMQPGGIICGDDVHHPPVVQAVTEAFGSFRQAATLWIWQVPA